MRHDVRLPLPPPLCPLSGHCPIPRHKWLIMRRMPGYWAVGKCCRLDGLDDDARPWAFLGCQHNLNSSKQVACAVDIEFGNRAVSLTDTDDIRTVAFIALCFHGLTIAQSRHKVKIYLQLYCVVNQQVTPLDSTSRLWLAIHCWLGRLFV